MSTTMINSDAMVACMKAFIDPNVIDHDGEFETVVGRRREECSAVLDSWPVRGAPTSEQLRLAFQATSHLNGYPHRRDAYIEETYGLSREQINGLQLYWDGWKDGSKPTEQREWRGMPRGIKLFSGSNAHEDVSGRQTQIFLRVDTDIANHFREAFHKESYRGIQDVLRAYVDDQKAN